MALNGKQESTSKALAISLRLIKKDVPLCKLVVSYADLDQEHYGTIYQATNWVFEKCTMVGQSDGSYIINNKRIHGKTISDKIKRAGGLKGLSRLKWVQKHLDKNATAYRTKGKVKYLYPLNKGCKRNL